MVTLAATPALAQQLTHHFNATPSGAQQVPPTASAGTASAFLALSPTVFVSISLTFSGLTGSQTTVDVHGPAAPGATGPVVLTLTAAGTTSGSAGGQFMPTPQQRAEIRAGLWYIDVHTTVFPGGEIRGQFGPDPVFLAALTAAQPVPPTPSPGTSTATVALSTDESRAEVIVKYSGLTGGSTGIHIHGPALPGAVGPILLTVTGPNGSDSLSFLTAWSPTPLQVAQLKAGQLYIDVHSTSSPDGALRGQIKVANQVTDFDGDGRAEVGVYRELQSSVWYLLNQATNAFNAMAFGTVADALTPGDFDGDGRTDIAIRRPNTGIFYVWRSSTSSLMSLPWGVASDDARVSSDYDGDGKVDIAVWRAGSPGTQSIFHVLGTSSDAYFAFPWGLGGSDVSVMGDYDGDRKADFGVYRTAPGTYYIQRSTLGFLAQQFGVSATDWLVPGDYDGDGKVDLAVFRRSTGVWYIFQSATGTLRAEAFGVPTPLPDIPVPADFDGDNKTDLAVTRTSGGQYVWYILLSSTGALKVVPFGAAGDARLHNYLLR
jgi:hypothetical protein